MRTDPPIFTLWYDVVGLVTDRVSRFPRSLRPSLGNRLLDRSLDVLDLLTRLRYSKRRTQLFPEANLAL